MGKARVTTLVLLLCCSAAWLPLCQAWELPKLPDFSELPDWPVMFEIVKQEFNVFMESIASAFRGPDAIAVLDADNFDEVVQAAEVFLVAFTVPWCKHCRRLMPQLRAAAKQMLKEAPGGPERGAPGASGRILVGNVDMNKKENKLLLESMGVKRFPTLRVFGKGKPKEGIAYQGGRTAMELRNSLLQLLGPEVEEVESEQQLARMQNRFPIVVLGVFPRGSTPANARQQFAHAASSLRHAYKFAAATDPAAVPECARHAEWCSGSATVLLYSPYDESAVVYQGDFKDAGLEDWLEQHARPKVVEVDGEHLTQVQQDALASNLPRVVAVTGKEDRDAARRALESAASHLEGYRFILLHDSVPWAMQYSGVRREQLPALLLVDEHGKRLKANADPEKCLAEWIREYEEGALPLHYRSEASPPKMKAPVFGVTADTFQEAVMSSKTPVLLELYRPNCPACKRFAAGYRDAAAALEAAGVRVAAAAMNVGENDIPDPRFKVTHIPSVFLVHGDDVTKYIGSHSKGELQEWVTRQLAGAESEGQQAGESAEGASKDEL